jgi:ketosteroid isomerase-like protein
MSQENVEIVRAIYEEYGRGNFRAGVDLYDPDVLLVTRPDLPDGGRFVGVESISTYMREFLDPVTNLTWTAEEFTDAENSVVVATHQQGEGKGSGLSVQVHFFVVWTFRGRAVIRIEFFADRADALEAVGLSE